MNFIRDDDDDDDDDDDHDDQSTRGLGFKVVREKNVRDSAFSTQLVPIRTLENLSTTLIWGPQDYQ